MASGPNNGSLGYVPGSTTNVVTLAPFMFNERNRYNMSAVWSATNPVYYRLEGTSIAFIPAPQGVYTITLYYVPSCTRLASGSDTVDGVDGWEEYVVIDAAIKCLLKDGQQNDAAALMAQKQAMKTRIEGLAAARDAGHPERVRDVCDDYDGYSQWTWTR